MCVKTPRFANVLKLSNFHPLEVVGRGSETKHQVLVVDNFNYLIGCFKG